MNYFSQLISLFIQATRKTFIYENLLFFKNTFIFIQGEACYAFAKARYTERCVARLDASLSPGHW